MLVCIGHGWRRLSSLQSPAWRSAAVAARKPRCAASPEAGGAHARTLSITRTGHGREWLSLGMSSPSPRLNFVFDIRFRLSRPQGTPHDATATATITAVRIGGQSAFTAAHPAPRVGESFRIRLRNGVLTSGLSGAHYCGPGVDWPKAGCGV